MARLLQFLLAIFILLIPNFVGAEFTTIVKRDIPVSCETVSGTSTCGIGVQAPVSTVEISSSDSSTWTETFYGASLTDFATYTGSIATTITTTDSAGETIVAAIFAGGLAWLAVPKPGVPPVGPPLEQPLLTPAPTPTSVPTSQVTSTTTIPTTSSSTVPNPGFYTMTVLPAPSTPFQLPMQYPDNDTSCGIKNSDWPLFNFSLGTDLAKEFCSEYSDQIAFPGKPLDKITNIGAGALLNASATANPACANVFDEWTVDESDCKYFLGEAINNCYQDGMSQGGHIDNACLTWSMIPSYNPGELECTGSVQDSTGGNRDEEIDNIQYFCSKFNGSISTANPTISNSWTFLPIIGNSKTTISVEYSTNSDCTPPEGVTGEYLIDATACERFLRQTIDGCNTDYTGNGGKFGGSITDGCGVYHLDLEIFERTLCGGHQNAKHNMTRNDAAQAIAQFCGNSAFYLDPAVHVNTLTNFSIGPPKGAAWDTWNGFEHGTDYYILMEAQWNEGWQVGTPFYQQGCVLEKRYQIGGGIAGADCTRKLNNIVDACSLDSGGWLVDITQNGCAIWSIYPDGPTS